MRTIWTLIIAICLVPIVVHSGCEIPYSGHLGPQDFNGWIESEANGFVCLYNGFDRICIKTIPGHDGKDGRDGKDGKDGRDGRDGQTFIAIREVPVETIVKKIIETVVVEEVIKVVPVEIVVERVVTEYVDREVPIEIFIERTVEIIREVIKEVPVEKIVEVEVIKEVPVETVKEVEVIKEVEVPVEVAREVEVPVEVIKEVPVEVEVIREVEVIKEVPVEKIIEVVKTIYVKAADPISVTAGATYTESGYHNPPNGFHAHTFTHTHDGASHTHRIIHPNGEQDDWDREHDGFSGLSHD